MILWYIVLLLTANYYICGLALPFHREHCPFVKKQKCIFAQSEVEHLGLVVSSKGVAFAHSKIQVMEEWPIRQSIKALFGFLGHTGYYRKFVTSSGKISAFKWNEEAMKAFMSLKHAITTTPALPCLVLTSCLWLNMMLWGLVSELY